MNWPEGISRVPNECLVQGPDALLCTAEAFDSAAVPSVYPGKTVVIKVVGSMQAPRGRGTVPVTVIVDPSGTTLDGVLSNNRLTLSLPVP